MTLIFALKWILEGKEGIVISSDSKATIGPISYETRKVYPILLKVDGKFVPLAVAGGAGEASLVKQGYRICEKVLTEMAVKDWDMKTPSFEQFEEAVGRIESTLIGRFRELREHGLEPSFSMILTSVDINGKASIYLFDDRGLAEPVHENPGFAIIGTGFITGGSLLLRLLGYDPQESYVLDVGALSTFIIDIVSEVDPAVGSFVGESYYMRAEEEGVLLGPLKEEAIREYKEKAKQRKEIIKRLWRSLDTLGEREILQKLEELNSEKDDRPGLET